MAPIPIVDISAFTSESDAAAKAKTAEELGCVLKAHGCAGITGHGLAPRMINEAFSNLKQFFALPMDVKMQAPHPDAATPHVGYSWPKRENARFKGIHDVDSPEEKAAIAKLSDWKESFDIRHPSDPDNIFLPPTYLPHFQPFFTQMWTSVNALTQTILEVIALSLHLPYADIATLRMHHTGAENSLRIAHYLPLPPALRADETLTRLAPHKDFSSFTFLFQEAHSGLEFRDRSTGKYMPAPPRPSDALFYLNIGDSMERLSNGVFPSALHRVTLPPVKDDEDVESRYSIPFFCQPSTDAVVGPLQSLVNKMGECKFEYLNATDYGNKYFKLTQEVK